MSHAAFWFVALVGSLIGACCGFPGAPLMRAAAGDQLQVTHPGWPHIGSSGCDALSAGPVLVPDLLDKVRCALVSLYQDLSLRFVRYMQRAVRRFTYGSLERCPTPQPLRKGRLDLRR